MNHYSAFPSTYGKFVLAKRVNLTRSLSSQDEKASNKTEEAKAEEKKPSKPVTVREPLEMVQQLDDVANTSEDALSTSVKKYDSKHAFVRKLHYIRSTFPW